MKIRKRVTVYRKLINFYRGVARFGDLEGVVSNTIIFQDFNTFINKRHLHF